MLGSTANNKKYHEKTFENSSIQTAELTKEFYTYLPIKKTIPWIFSDLVSD